MNAIRVNLAKQFPMFSVTYKLARKLQLDLKPSFSISSALFCAFVQSIFPTNPFMLYQLRTLSKKHRGGGGMPITSRLAPPNRK